MSGRKKKTVRKVRVAHELPKRRRMAIDEAMKEHQTEDRPEWDRTSLNAQRVKMEYEEIKDHQEARPALAKAIPQELGVQV